LFYSDCPSVARLSRAVLLYIIAPFLPNVKRLFASAASLSARWPRSEAHAQVSAKPGECTGRSFDFCASVDIVPTLSPFAFVQALKYIPLSPDEHTELALVPLVHAVKMVVEPVGCSVGAIKILGLVELLWRWRERPVNKRTLFFCFRKNWFDFQLIVNVTHFHFLLCCRRQEGFQPSSPAKRRDAKTMWFIYSPYDIDGGLRYNRLSACYCHFLLPLPFERGAYRFVLGVTVRSKRRHALDLFFTLSTPDQIRPSGVSKTQ
jgi:hypothetical protein